MPFNKSIQNSLTLERMDEDEHEQHVGLSSVLQIIKTNDYFISIEHYSIGFMNDKEQIFIKN